MKLDNHIVTRLLTDNKEFMVETIMSQAQNDGKSLEKEEIDKTLDSYADMIYLLNNDKNKTYYITKSVTQHLGLFDNKKAEGWKDGRYSKDYRTSKKLIFYRTPSRLMQSMAEADFSE